MKLSKAEEQLIYFLWKKDRAIMMELVDSYPDPKPAPTTVATLLKRMRDKGVVDYIQKGRAREYFALIKKKDYFTKQVNGLIKNFFDDSTSQFASYFTKEADLSKEQLEELRRMIDEEIKNK